MFWVRVFKVLHKRKAGLSLGLLGWGVVDGVVGIPFYELPGVCKRWFPNGGSSLVWRADSGNPF